MTDDKNKKKKDAIHVCLNYISKNGFHPSKLTKWGIIYCIWGLTHNMIQFILISLNYILPDLTIENISRTTEAMLGFGTAIIKYMVLWLNRKKIHDILRSRQLFWSVDELPESQRKDVEWLITSPFMALRGYNYMITASAIIFALKPIWSENREMPLDCWVPEATHWKILVYLNQISAIFYNRPTFIGFDCFFFTICAEVILQFKILKHKMEHLNFEDAKQVKEIVDGHNFIIEFVEKLRDIYSLLFLSQIVITTLTICMELYLTLMIKQSISYAIKNVVFCLTVIWEFTFYCIPATEVSFNAMELTDAIYDSKWYNFNSKLMKYVCPIIMRAQQKLVFTAGGLHDITRETFTAVFKTSMSFYTMMKTIQEE